MALLIITSSVRVVGNGKSKNVGSETRNFCTAELCRYGIHLGIHPHAIFTLRVYFLTHAVHLECKRISNINYILIFYRFIGYADVLYLECILMRMRYQ